jgi:hypothetical protein
MGALTDDTAVLKLYTTLDGEMWFISGANPPKPSGYDYFEYCKKPKLVNKKSVVRVVGAARNAALICSLTNLKLTGAITDLQVCSPQVEKVNLDEYSPEKVLLNMRKWKYPPSIGGFHSLTQDDICVYAMIEASRRGTDISTVKVLHNLFKEHSLYNVLKFIPFLHMESCALLISIIIDPRWYVDVNAPNKLANLFDCLGIAGIKASDETEHVANPHPGGSKLEKRNIVLMSWRNDLSLEKNLETNFLTQTYSAARETFLPRKTKPGEIPFDEADIATSQKFISFIHGMWLDKLYPMPNNWNEPMFVPEYFFRSKEEVERFNSFFKKK